MQGKSEDDEDSFSLNIAENKNFDFDESTMAEDLPKLAMSSHPPSKHYPFSRRATSQNLLDTDSDDDGHLITDVNPSRFISNSSELSLKQSSNDEAPPVFSRQSSMNRVPSAGPSGRQPIMRVKSPKPREKQERTSSISDSDESDEMGVAKKKKAVVPGEYDPVLYEHLEVNDEVKEIFQYIIKYIPQHLNLDFKFKPFIPDFIPAVGDIDAFLKIGSPEKTLSGEIFDATKFQLGLTVLDEPASNQSDPALLHLQLRAASISVSHTNQMMVVKKVDNVEKNIKTIDKWIKDVSELHRNKAAAVVRYSNPMPDIDDLMQEWTERFENAIKLHSIPSSKFCGTLSQYIDVMCTVFDVPVYKNKIQSLHVMFCLYASIKNSQLYRATNAFEGRDNAEVGSATLGKKADHLVLD